MAMERWVYINDDGALVLHEDGWSFLRRGAEAVEQVVTLDELKRHHPNQYEKAVKLLADRKGRDA